MQFKAMIKEDPFFLCMWKIFWKLYAPFDDMNRLWHIWFIKNGKKFIESLFFKVIFFKISKCEVYYLLYQFPWCKVPVRMSKKKIFFWRSNNSLAYLELNFQKTHTNEWKFLWLSFKVNHLEFYPKKFRTFVFVVLY